MYHLFIIQSPVLSCSLHINAYSPSINIYNFHCRQLHSYKIHRYELPKNAVSSDSPHLQRKIYVLPRNTHSEEPGKLDIPMEDYIYACKTDTDKYAKEIEKKYSRYIDGNTLPRFSLKHIISSSKGASSKTVLLYILPLDNENQIHFEGGKFVSPEEIEANEHNYSSFWKKKLNIWT